MEGDHGNNPISATRRDFYPRPPGGGRHSQSDGNFDFLIFLSTPSGWRATLDPERYGATNVDISIHALRVEGDSQRGYTHRLRRDFYPRPPGGGRPVTMLYALADQIFLSTPSGWRATGAAGGSASKRGFLSTPSGWRATYKKMTGDAPRLISIHALRVEGDFNFF